MHPLDRPKRLLYSYWLLTFLKFIRDIVYVSVVYSGAPAAVDSGGCGRENETTQSLYPNFNNIYKRKYMNSGASLGRRVLAHSLCSLTRSLLPQRGTRAYRVDYSALKARQPGAHPRRDLKLFRLSLAYCFWRNYDSFGYSSYLYCFNRIQY